MHLKIFNTVNKHVDLGRSIYRPIYKERVITNSIILSIGTCHLYSVYLKQKFLTSMKCTYKLFFHLVTELIAQIL